MEEQLRSVLKSVKMNEATISTVIGALVILVVALSVFNYFRTYRPGAGITDSGENVENVTPTGKPNENVKIGDTYMVEKGDSLWTISERFYKSGYNWVDIASANNLSNPDQIEVGSEIKIPQVETKTLTVASEETVKLADSIEENEYTIASGDNLWKIAVRAYGDGYSWSKIYDANKEAIGANPSLIEKGVKISIPR